MHSGFTQTMTLFLVSMTLGYASWVLPYILIAGPVEGETPLLIHFSSDPELAHPVLLICLFVSGIVVGLFTKGYGWSVLTGAATGFPILAFALAEMVLGLASHNLWPIEFAMYAVFTIPPIIGSLLGVLVKEKRSDVLDFYEWMKKS